jgi:hypothetical protein
LKGKGKERKKRDLQNVTCYGCGKKGHVRAKCPDGEKKEEKTKKRDDKSKPAKEKEEASTSKSLSGTLYTEVSHSSLASTGDSMNTFYVDSGASYHLIPSQGDLRAYQKFAKPVEISAANRGRSMLTVLGPCEWQRQLTV